MATENRKILAEQASLRTIINSLNTNIYEFDEPKNIRIYSKEKNKLGYVIVIMEFDVKENISEIISLSPELIGKDSDFSFESNLFEYVVLSMSKVDAGVGSEKYMLVNIPLFELIVTSESIISDDSGKHHIDNMIDGWSLDAEIWNCFEITEN